VTSGEKALAEALRHVGQHEVGGENQGPIVEWSIGRWTSRLPAKWARWCAGFVSTCIDEADAGGPDWHHLASLSCDHLYQRTVNAGCETGQDLADAQPGDLVFFGDLADLDHVGFVVQVHGDTLTTVEGNCRNAVSVEEYSLAAPSRPLAAWVRLP